MIVEINNETTIRDVQEVFSTAYPFLKLEFFDKPHSWGEHCVNAHCYDPGFKLFTIEKRAKAPKFIRLSPWEKTGTLEEEFKDLFGLYAQVYRRFGNKWVQTAGTDDLSLSEQDEIGKKSVEHYMDSHIESRSLL
jgi:hypothetical protein